MNALSPIVVTDGMDTEVKDAQEPNAVLPIAVIDGIETEVKLSQV